MQYRNKPLVPYGTILKQLLSCNLKPAFGIYVFCGQDAWQEAKRMNEEHPPALCLPPNAEVSLYEWPINDLPLILYNTGGLTLDDCNQHAMDLLTLGASQVTVFSENNVSDVYNR